jgi:integrase
MSRKRRGRDEGSIYQRADGLWVASVSLGQDAEGKRIRKTIYGKDKKVVKEKLLKIQQDHASGLAVKTDNTTVDQHFQDWLRVKKAEVQEKTYNSYKGLYENHIKPALGHLKLKNLDYRKINALYEKLDNKGLSKRTVSYISVLLRSSLEDANRKGLVTNNQAKLAASRRPDKKEARFMTQDETKRFVEALEGERMKNAFVLALHTGLRAGEFFGLSWDAIDWKKKLLTVKQALHDENGNLFIDRVKTPAGQRTISLSEIAITVLRAQEKQQTADELKAKAGTYKNEFNLVFTTDKGAPLRRNNICRRDLKDILERSKLKGVTLHSLRHTHATILIYQGVDIKTISKRLGHEDVAFTLQVYGHLLPGQDERAANMMDDYIKTMNETK